MSLIIRRAISLLGKREHRRLEQAAISPANAQRRFLVELLKRNAATVFGRQHGFASICTEADYRRHVPIRDYEGFRPYINRVMTGESMVLTADQPVMFTMTSGTTAEPKLIPVTRESQMIESALTRQWFYRALLDHPEFMNHSGIGIVSRAIEGVTASGIPYGSASGMTYKNIPWLIRRVQAIPYEVCEILDYERRYFVTACFALDANVSFIATANPGTLIRLARTIAEYSTELVRAIHDGDLGVASPGQRALFDRLQARLKPNPARARILDAILHQSGSLHPPDFWPMLRLIGCWVGGSVGMQASKLAEYYGKTSIRDLGYMASEGHFTVPCEDQTARGILALNSNYYEFVPTQQTECSQSEVLSSHELEDGKRYSILLTTASGLYRYRIHDIVEVAGHYKHAPLLAFVRKEGEMANISGEKIHANQLLLSVEQARQKFDLSIEQFQVTPDYQRSRYESFLELSGEVSRSELQKFLTEVDSTLGRFNIEYEQKRASRRLSAPCLHIMSQGWADRAHRRMIGAGQRDSQYKWPILLSDPNPADKGSIIYSIEAQSREFTRRELGAAA